LVIPDRSVDQGTSQVRSLSCIPLIKAVTKPDEVEIRCDTTVEDELLGNTSDSDTFGRCPQLYSLVNP
jgi:hypothetical protein